MSGCSRSAGWPNNGLRASPLTQSLPDDPGSGGDLLAAPSRRTRPSCSWRRRGVVSAAQVIDSQSFTPRPPSETNTVIFGLDQASDR
jgi:hypothetical protein